MSQSEPTILSDFVRRPLFPGRCGLIGDQETAFGSVAKKDLLIHGAAVDRVHQEPVLRKGHGHVTVLSRSIGVLGGGSPPAQ